jgi:lipopolysaccharide/colanic/teichoic acid biosynthesis glycosyltransferase
LNATASRSREELWLQKGLKRLLDIVISVVAIILLAPVFAALWLAVRLETPGPAIFRQQRVGQHGEVFTCLKFRTMFYNADENVHREAIQRLCAGERLSDDPGSPYKMAGDPRVTRVGRWLRWTSLDELPQLINVLRGEMSIVGPRPAIPYELEHFQAWHYERHKVKPGITGLWQVRGRGCMNLEGMLKLDVEYARTWTVWTDLKLIALTVPSVLKARGAR